MLRIFFALFLKGEKMKIKLFFAGICLASLAFAQDPPTGFEDPVLLGSVMGGKVIYQDKIDTKIEFETVAKAFFTKTSPEAYAMLAVNHPKYPQLFQEVKEGHTTKISEDKLDYDYRLKLVIQAGFITQEVFPEGHQHLIPAADAISEYRIQNAITNYTDDIKSATQVTRLIPYDNGILVEDDVHVILQKPSAQSNIIKKKLKEFFSKYVLAFRKELTGQ